jgi:hypothetical protein
VSGPRLARAARPAATRRGFSPAAALPPSSVSAVRPPIAGRPVPPRAKCRPHPGGHPPHQQRGLGRAGLGSGPGRQTGRRRRLRPAAAGAGRPGQPAGRGWGSARQGGAGVASRHRGPWAARSRTATTVPPGPPVCPSGVRQEPQRTELWRLALPTEPGGDLPRR